MSLSLKLHTYNWYFGKKQEPYISQGIPEDKYFLDF